ASARWRSERTRRQAQRTARRPRMTRDGAYRSPPSTADAATIPNPGNWCQTPFFRKLVSDTIFRAQASATPCRLCDNLMAMDTERLTRFVDAEWNDDI